MSSVREQVLETILSAYNTGRPAGVPPAERSRYVAIDEGQLPVTVLQPEKEKVEPAKGRFGPLVMRSFRMMLLHRTAGSSSVSPDQAVDPLLSWGVKALCGQKPGTALGNLVIEIREADLEWHFQTEGAVPTLLTVHTFEVFYTTRVNDAEQRV